MGVSGYITRKFFTKSHWQRKEPIGSVDSVSSSLGVCLSGTAPVTPVLEELPNCASSPIPQFNAQC